MVLVPGELDVEKGTNMLKCPVVESGCKSVGKYGSSIVCSKFLTNDGFSLSYNVSLSGFCLSKSEISRISSLVYCLLKKSVKQLSIEHLMNDEQLELF